jgi:hypothetical protein
MNTLIHICYVTQLGEISPIRADSFLIQYEHKLNYLCNYVDFPINWAKVESLLVIQCMLNIDANQCCESYNSTPVKLTEMQ